MPAEPDSRSSSTPMSLRSRGSFSFRTTAAVVCLENTETHPCETLERRTTAATCSVTSMNSRAAVVRKASVSAQIVRPPMRRTRAPAWSSEPSSRRRAGLAALPTNRCCACNVTRAVTDGHRRYSRTSPALPPRRADLVEAVAAVHGAAHGGREGDLGGLAALGADDFVELLGATGAPNVAVDRPAVGTAGRLVLESLRGVELLLTDGEDEVETTVTARQSLVAEAHGESPLFCLWISEVSPERSVALDPTFPGAIIASAKAFLAMAKRLALSITRYSAAVVRTLFLIEDELLFAQRLRAAAGRLGIPVQAVSPSDARTRAWDRDQVVVLQATLRPEQQLELIDHLTGRDPAPVVIAVTGHLETELRQRLKARGAILAGHSGMDRVLARALRVSVPGDAAPHPRT